MNKSIIDMLRAEATNDVIKQIKDGKLTLETDEVGIIPPFLAANLVDNHLIIEVLDAMNELIMDDNTMGKEYVSFFLNRVREIANEGLTARRRF